MGVRPGPATILVVGVPSGIVIYTMNAAIDLARIRVPERPVMGWLEQRWGEQPSISNGRLFQIEKPLVRNAAEEAKTEQKAPPSLSAIFADALLSRLRYCTALDVRGAFKRDTVLRRVVDLSVDDPIHHSF